MNVDRELRVVIVDDHDLLAESLIAWLADSGVRAVRAPLDEPGVLATVVAVDPHVVLLDLDLGEGTGQGLGLVSSVRERGPQVLVLSGSRDRLLLASCLEAGAHGFVAKSRSLESLEAAIRATAAGIPVITSAQRWELLAELRRARSQRESELAPFQQLTRREREVLAAVMQGRTAAEIATDKVVSEATVRTQIRGVLGKLGVGSQLAAAALAWRRDWHGAPGRHGTDGTSAGG